MFVYALLIRLAGLRATGPRANHVPRVGIWWIHTNNNYTLMVLLICKCYTQGSYMFLKGSILTTATRFVYPRMFLNSSSSSAGRLYPMFSKTQIIKNRILFVICCPVFDKFPDM